MPIDRCLLVKAAQVYEAAEPVKAIKPKQLRTSHTKCTPREFMRHKAGSEKRAEPAAAPAPAPAPAPSPAAGESPWYYHPAILGGLGLGTAGLIHGAMDPGVDEEGRKRNRLTSALTRGLGYGAAGLGAGLAYQHAVPQSWKNWLGSLGQGAATSPAPEPEPEVDLAHVPAPQPPAPASEAPLVDVGPVERFKTPAPADHAFQSELNHPMVQALPDTPPADSYEQFVNALRAANPDLVQPMGADIPPLRPAPALIAAPEATRETPPPGVVGGTFANLGNNARAAANRVAQTYEAARDWYNSPRRMTAEQRDAKFGPEARELRRARVSKNLSTNQQQRFENPEE